MGIEQNGQLGFSFACPDKDVERVTDSLIGLGLSESAVSSDGFHNAVITGKCGREQDRMLAQTVLESGDVSLIRHTVITFEDLSKRELLRGGGVSTVVHQIAIRSLIRGIEED